MELDALGNSEPRKEADARLKKLEAEIFGNDFTDASQNINDRVIKLMSGLRPSDQLVEHLVYEKLKVPDWSSKQAKPPWLNTSFQSVCLLESEILGSVTPSKALIERIQELEKVVWKDSTPPAQASISDRIELLRQAISPSVQAEASTEKRLRKLGLLGSQDSIAWMSSMGKGAKKAGKKVVKMTQPVRGFLQSPTFWLAVIGAGAAVGLFFAARGSGSGSSPQDDLVIYPNRGCHGSTDCHPCTNCHDCIWCNKGGSPKCNKWIYR